MFNKLLKEKAMSYFKKMKTKRLVRYYFLYTSVVMMLVDADEWLEDLKVIEAELKERGEYDFTFEESLAYYKAVEKAAVLIKEEYEPS